MQAGPTRDVEEGLLVGQAHDRYPFTTSGLWTLIGLPAA
jgi:hypothetical protein